MLRSHFRRLAAIGVWIAGVYGSAVRAEPSPNTAVSVAVAALPYQPDPAVNRLFRALWNLPMGLVEGPVAELRAKGGAFWIQSDDRGLVVRAEGPAPQRDLVKQAAQYFATGQFAAALLPRAKAMALKADALTPQTTRQRAAARMWQLFYGDNVPNPGLRVEDIALLRLQAADVAAFQQQLQGQHAIFFAHDSEVSASSYVPAMPPPKPGPASIPLTIAAGEEVRIFLGQPVPPLPALRDDRGQAWLRALQTSFADLNGTVHLDFRPAAALLILELPLQERSPEAVRELIAQRVGKLGPPLPTSKPQRSAPTDEEGGSKPQSISELWVHRAEDHLLFGHAPAEMTERLWAETWRLVLSPEAMRAVVLVPKEAR